MKPIEYLKNCDIVKLDNGVLYLYLQDYFGKPCFVRDDGYMPLSKYNENLEVENYNSYNVSKIYRTNAVGYGFSLLDMYESDFTLIWNARNTIVLTMKDIAKKFGVDRVIITDYKN